MKDIMDSEFKTLNGISLKYLITTLKNENCVC